MVSDAASAKPYLLRAMYEWCVDQGCTPHLAVLVDDNVLIPPGYARDGQIVLNIGPEATNQLAMGNEAITFQARFAGVVHSIYVPVGHVCAIYAAQNGQGMAFEPDLQAAAESAPKAPDVTPLPQDDADASARTAPVLHCTEGVGKKSADDNGNDDDDKPPPGGGGRRTRLTVVK